jgi:protein TonB
LGIDIEWGGGGNRTVIYKVLPQYPRGHNVAGRVRLRFTVLPDGTVGLIVPLQRTDPLLERAAIEALRQWRFNPLPTATEMVGVITFTFELE